VNPIIPKTLRRLFGVVDDEAVAQQSLAEQSLKEGNQWTFSEVVTLATDETTRLFIDNALTSRELRVVGVSLNPTEVIEGSWYANVTEDVAGVDFDYLNNRASDPPQDDPSFTVALGGSYSSLGAGYSFESAAGPQQVGNRPRGTAAPEAAAFRVDPGGNRLLEITSQAEANVVTIQTTVSTRPD